MDGYGKESGTAGIAVDLYDGEHHENNKMKAIF